MLSVTSTVRSLRRPAIISIKRNMSCTQRSWLYATMLQFLISHPISPRNSGRWMFRSTMRASCFRKLVLDQELPDFKRVIRINLSSVFNGTQAAGREMKKNGGGVIINSASFAGILPTAYRCSYAVSKAGIIAFTKEAAAELASHQIRVVAIAPGMVEIGVMSERLKGPEREEIIS